MYRGDHNFQKVTTKMRRLENFDQNILKYISYLKQIFYSLHVMQASVLLMKPLKFPVSVALFRICSSSNA